LDIKTLVLRARSQKNAFGIKLLPFVNSWANSHSRRYYEEGKISKFRSLDPDAADELLAALDAATSLKNLSPLKSVEKGGRSCRACMGPSAGGGLRLEAGATRMEV
jgi:hypothetical protein